MAENTVTEKQAEGLAIVDAILSGECDKCPSFAECRVNEHFKFPVDAYCMKQKAIVMKGWAEDGN